MSMPATAEKHKQYLPEASTQAVAVVLFMDQTHTTDMHPIQRLVGNFKDHADGRHADGRHSITRQYALVGSIPAFQADIGTNNEMKALCEKKGFCFEGMHSTTSW